MQDPDEGLRNYFRNIDSVKPDSPEDTELAYRLQNASPGDLTLLEQLLYSYADGLYQWVSLLLFYRQKTNPSHEEILSVIIKVFGTACKHVEQFHGMEHISAWLFGIGYQSVRHYKGKNQSIDLIQEKYRGELPGSLFDRYGSPYWESLDRLPEKLRSPLILRYLFKFDIHEIASILNIQEHDVHRRLVIGRKQLIVNPFKAHLDLLIQSYLDGLLVNDPRELNRLTQHLESCALCQKWVVKINSLEKTLSNSLQLRWIHPPLSPAVLNHLIQSITNDLDHPKLGWNVQPKLLQIGWILGLALLVIGMSVVLARFTTFDDQLQQPGITPTQNLPPVVDIQSAFSSSLYGNDVTTEPQFIEPAFSSDGQWAVFASIKSIPATWGRSFPTIEIYNREANTLHVISEGIAPSDKPWIWWDYAPGISGDGSWVVYVSTTNDPDTKGEPCETPEHDTCLDIFLYNRNTGYTRRLTQAVNGGPADGDSLAPTISEDGKWVAFWSTATNLANSFTNTCQQGETRLSCLYIYIYNIETGNITWIPIPTIPGDPIFGVDRISLSADGRYLGFTVTASSHIGSLSPENLLSPNLVVDSATSTTMITSIPQILHSSEAVVFDQVTGKYEFENQAQDSTPGNGESSSPVLSADGRYVVFTSASSNIVPGDNNNYHDVFIRDRTTGEVELISVSSLGWKGRSDSGLSYLGHGYFSLNISADGRYVIFESSATNLGYDLNSECNKIDISNCIYLYVHDRQTNSTEWVTALPNPDFIFFPQVSSDGRWVSFMQSLQNCSSTQILCSNVMLFDRQRSWMTNLTKYKQTVPNLGWSYSDNLLIPWQTWESRAIAFSPDGNLLALGGADSKVRIWQGSNDSHSVNLGSPSEVLEADGNEYFSSLAFTPNGGWLAGGTTTGSIYLWNLSDGKLINMVKYQTNLVRKLAFSHSGTDLVISTLNGAWIWNLDTNQLSVVNNDAPEQTGFSAVDITAGGNLLASARGDGLVWLQRMPSGNVIGRLGVNQQFVSNLTFSEDGSLLAVRSSTGAINLWQISALDSVTPSFKLINTFRSYIYDGALTFSPNNKYLASSGLTGGVTLWELPEGKIFTLSNSANIGMVYSLAFSKDSEKLAAVVENKIVLWGLHPDRSSQYFVRALDDMYIDSSPIPAPTASDNPALQSPESISVVGSMNLDQAESKMDFPISVPTHLPVNINFNSASVNQDGSILLRYDASDPELSQATLFIYEIFIGDSIPPATTIGAGADVIPTHVETVAGRASAEYVQGDWSWRQSYTPPSRYSSSGAFHEVVDWDFTSNTQRLRWEQNGVLIALYYQANRMYTPVIDNQLAIGNTVNVGSILNQADLEQIASWMIPFSETNRQVTSNKLSQARAYPSTSSEANGGNILSMMNCRVKER